MECNVYGNITGITYTYSTPIRVCKNKRIKRNKVSKYNAQGEKIFSAMFAKKTMQQPLSF